jgi:hypothetical protein
MAVADNLAVNQSGFPLQIGVSALVTRSTNVHGWKVLYTEHSWKNPFNESTGFIDLVLIDRHGTGFMAVECKRVLDSSWIFLISNPQQMERRHAKAWVARYRNGTATWFDWADITLDPRTPESGYCIVRGQDAKARPLLERVGAELVCATEALAHEEQRIRSQRHDAWRFFFNVIITTATLKVCEFPEEKVSLNDGKIHGSTFHEVPYLRFRKQLSVRFPGAQSSFASGDELAYAKAHTVFVVNAGHLGQFLSEFAIDGTNLQRFDDRC